MLPEHRRLTPCERLWLAVLDQACLDVGSSRRRVRVAAERWWATEAPERLARFCQLPISVLPRLRAQRGGLRVGVDARQEGRHLPPAYVEPLPVSVPFYVPEIISEIPAA